MFFQPNPAEEKKKNPPTPTKSKCLNIKKQKEEFSKLKPNRHRNNRGDWTTYIGIKSSTSVDGYWEVSRKINGEVLHGGSFPTKKEAALASDKLYLLNIDKVEVNKLNFNRKVIY